MIAEYLAEGKDNARTGRELSNFLNIPIRDITLAIERERRAGQPICASTGGNPGYYLAANKEEMQGYCRSLYKRAGELFKTRRACLETLDGLPAEGADNG